MNEFLLTIRFIYRLIIRQTDCNGSRYVADCSFPNLYLTKDICVTTEVIHYGGQLIHDYYVTFDTRRFEKIRLATFGKTIYSLFV